ncbi:hypothetical protein SAMN05444280_105186 [Tangfeifania diversioriginum]|uniref:PHP domain-containing protein n=1 Tax=Tangfeifania diversioriginum TaxID=1168035 RepID=A0A1M6DUN6_9BACT|nr:hypothetical protein [Tangfeifania diversioriginum]SHI76885.1 hypothetical protein SAMN05444280_105186 [Tangfeifania diversioriginum]
MEQKESIFTSLPNEKELLSWYRNQPEESKIVPDINGHIHTPHSFSAFSDIELAFQMAKTEGISVLGVNDFFTTAGYEEFAQLAEKFKVFPLFNIEFIALQQDLQQAGIRVNDPNNPGRTYFSGKGLRYPVQMSSESEAAIKKLQQNSNQQAYQMVEKLNAFFVENQIELHFDAAELHKKLAKELFRERHIAQAIRTTIFEKKNTQDGRKRLFEKIFSGKELKVPIGKMAMVENEIRSNLLKAGGPAFVKENPDEFLSLEQVMDIITDAGGIPCYPVLLDDAKGNFTDFEADKEKLLQTFREKDIWAIELIPGRNNFEILKDFVSFFHKNDFIVTFGTEHNTPQLDPLKVTCRGGVDLDDELKQINYEGAAIIAAHQYYIARGMMGWLNGEKARVTEKERFIELGKAVINRFLKN